ncbi:MAG: acetyl-CoA carboxylase biotin carboxyl carrier protein subunit [Vicinamibacterales bacterium]
MSERPDVTLVRDGEYIVTVDGRRHRVFLAGEAGDRWLYWNGHVFRRPFDSSATAATHASGERRQSGHQSLSAPMPAKVLKVAVEPGASVHAGDTLVVLEAMKMELPVRADVDAIVSRVHCQVGELVQAGAVLVELT